MRRRCSIGILAIGANLLLASASRADDAKTPDGLLQKGAKLARSCREPKPGWLEKTLSGNFDSCSGAVKAFVKAIELSKKNAETVKAATLPLTAANVNLVRTAYDLGLIHQQRGNQTSAARFFLAACNSATLPFGEPNSDQSSILMATGTQAESLLDDNQKKRCDGRVVYD